MLVVVAVLILVVLLWYFTSRSSVASTEQLGANRKIVLFYADWCPACQRTKPIWNAVKAKLPNHNFEEINISDKELADSKEREYGVNVPSIPTILIVKNGKADEYKGPKTFSAMLQAFV
jgi:thiol-disulfide isomerase/thioredoxin